MTACMYQYIGKHFEPYHYGMNKHSKPQTKENINHVTVYMTLLYYYRM